MIKVALIGMGRMGREIANELRASYANKAQIVACIDLAQGSYEGMSILPADKLESALKGVDVAIDFTTPAAEPALAERIAKCGVDLVIGTTGIGEADLAKIRESVKKCAVSAVIAPNFSILVNVHFALAKKAATTLRGLSYDFAVFEEHHTGKVDSPSGTARKLAEVVIAEGAAKRINFRGAGKKKHEQGEIDMAITRVGGMPGYHELRVGGAHGLLNITSLMYSRKEFATGAIESALWLNKNRKPGKVFTMEDVLKL